MIKTPSQSRILQIVTILLAFILIGLLSIYGIKGVFSRYAQDDYCYGYRVRTTGFWNTQIQSYLDKAEYVSNRFSTTLAHSIVEEMGGPKFVPYLTSLELLAWLAALIYAFYQLQQVNFSKTSLRVAILSTLTIIFFSTYLAPNQYQILFWLSGMQTYFTPIILATFVFGRFIAIARAPKFKFLHLVELGSLSFFAGGFSETTSICQFTCWGLILIWALFRQKQVGFAKKAIRPAVVLVVCTALALFALAFSPANLKGAPVPYHPGFFLLIEQSSLYGMEFIYDAVKGTPVPYLVILLLGFFISTANPPQQGLKAKDFVRNIIAAFLVVCIVSVVIMLPAMYTTSHYPGDRALLPAGVFLVIFFFLTGGEIAKLISVFKPSLFSSQTVIILQCFLGLALFVYMVHITPRVYDKLKDFRERAIAWDQRQNLILQEKAAGIKDVIAPALESIYGITELHYEASNWVNQCAARYYGVQSISTVDNYAGISTHPIGK